MANPVEARHAPVDLVRGGMRTVADLRAGDRVRYRGMLVDVLRVEDTIPQFTREPLRVIYGQAGDAPPVHVAWPLGDLVEVIAG